MKKLNIRFVIEILFVFIFFLILTLSFLVDITALKLPKLFILRYANYNDLFLELFSIQASLSSVGLAIISLLAGASEKTLYGISISKYVMQKRPYIFKHSIVVIASIVMIPINYLCMAYNLFNLSIFIFITSFSLILLLTLNILKFFSNPDYIEKEMANYFIENAICRNLLSDFLSETTVAVEINNYLLVKSNIKVFPALFNNIFSSNLIDSTKSKEELEKYYGNIIDVTYNSNNISIKTSILNTLLEIYDVANKKERNELTTLFIYMYSERDIISIISEFTLRQHEENYILSSLHKAFYDNLFIDSSKSDVFVNGHSLHLWSARIYYTFFVKNNYYTSDEKERIVNWLISDINHVKRLSTSPLKIELLEKELAVLFKAILDSLDTKSFNQYWFDSEFVFRENKEVFVCLCMYLYYLSEREKEYLTTDDLKLFAMEAIDSKGNNFSILKNYFTNLINTKLSDVKIELHKYIKLLDSWEIMPLKSAKFMMMDYVVKDFFLWSLIINSARDKTLYELLNEIVDKNSAFSYYNSYFSPNREVQSFKDFTVFYNKFYNPYNFDDSNYTKNKFQTFKNTLARLYKEKELKHGKEHILSDDKLKDSINKTELLLSEKIQQIFPKGVLVDNIPQKCELKEITYQPYPIYTDSIDYTIENYLSSYLDEFLISALSLILNGNIIIDEKPFDDDDILKSFLEIVSKFKLLDTIIGYPHWLFDYEKTKESEEFDKFINDKTMIESSDHFLAFNSKAVSVKVEHVIVEINDYSWEMIEHNYKLDEEGNYLYNITNDLYIPFSKDELTSHMKNTMKYVSIRLGVRTSFTNKIIGGGVVLKR